MGNKEIFEMTREHLILLSKMCVGWEYCEFGSPNIDPKRPYGNSDVVLDIAEKLGWELFTDTEETKHLSEKQYEQAKKLHKETELALQICLSTQSFKEGFYRMREPYNSRSWILVS